MPFVKVPNLVASQARDFFADLCITGKIRMAMDPEDNGGITEQDIFGVVIGVLDMTTPYLKIEFELHEPHRFIDRSRYEIRRFDDKTFIVQIELTDDYVPGTFEKEPVDEEALEG